MQFQQRLFTAQSNFKQFFQLLTSLLALLDLAVSEKEFDLYFQQVVIFLGKAIDSHAAYFQLVRLDQGFVSRVVNAGKQVIAKVKPKLIFKVHLIRVCEWIQAV